MNAVATVFAAVVLAAMVTYGSCQTSKTINCYACMGTYSAVTGAYVGCDYPFNSTSMQTVACPGVCTKAVIFQATDTSGYGVFDTIVRGCTITSPRTGCYMMENDLSHSGRSTCVATCSTDLCNSADGLRSATVALVGLVSMMAVAFSR